MPYQQELFGKTAVEPEQRTLAVRAASGRVLSKTQKAFNRLVARVEALRAEIKTTTARLEEALRRHDQEVRPRLDLLTGLRKDLARVLASFLRDPRLKRASDRALLRRVVADLIDEAAAHEGSIVDDDLRAIFDELTKDSTHPEATAADRAAFEAMRAEVETMFGAMGVKVDLSDLGPDAGEEDLHVRVRQAMDAARERGQIPDAPALRSRRRTKKQLEREERLRQAEEARHRTIGAIYKQLAKVLHPDLERDPQRQREKLGLMQELTAAHRANDLHTLLRLELAWLHKEEGDLNRLSEEKLEIYNTVLREQADELERERDAIWHHPRFQPLVTGSDGYGFRLELNSAARAASLDPVIRSMREDLASMQGPEPWREVRALLKSVRDQQRREPRVPF